MRLKRQWPELGQGDATWLTLEMEHDGHEPGRGEASRSLKKQGNRLSSSLQKAK